MLTLSITIERYCSVCHATCPFRAKSLLLPLPIMFAVLYNVPKFFEFRSKSSYEIFTHESSTSNQTLGQSNATNHTTPEPSIQFYYIVTDLRRNPWYIIIYVFWSNFLLVKIIPYVLMVVMNIQIWRKIQEFANIRRNALGINEGIIDIFYGHREAFHNNNI